MRVVSASMKEKLDSIIAICNQYNYNKLASEQKLRREKLKRKAEIAGKEAAEKTDSHGGWKFSNPSLASGARLSDYEIQRRNNEQPPPPQVCEGGVCHQATPDEIKYFEEKIRNKEAIPLP